MEKFDALEAAKNDTPIEEKEPEAPEQETEQEASTEPEAPTEPEAEPEQKENWVPLQRLFDERNRRYSLESQLKELKDEFDKLKQPAEPDFDEDPKKYVDHHLGSKESPITLDTVRQEIREYEVRNAIINDHQAAIKKHNDYEDALKHVREATEQQHILSGIDPEKARDIVYEGEYNLAKTLISKGLSPSEAVYDYAVKNLGFKPKKGDSLKTIKKGIESSTPAGGGDALKEPAEEKMDPFEQAKAEAFAYLRKR